MWVRYIAKSIREKPGGYDAVLFKHLPLVGYNLLGYFRQVLGAQGIGIFAVGYFANIVYAAFDCQNVVFNIFIGAYAGSLAGAQAGYQEKTDIINIPKWLNAIVKQLFYILWR